MGRNKKGGMIQLDPELREFIEGMMHNHPFWKVRLACLQRFGAHRAPSTQTISRFWRSDPSRLGVPRQATMSKVMKNDEMRRFIETNKPSMTFSCLSRKCRDYFGEDSPSASGINRYWMRTHGRTRRKRKQAGFVK